MVIKNNLYLGNNKEIKNVQVSNKEENKKEDKFYYTKSFAKEGAAIFGSAGAAVGLASGIGITLVKLNETPINPFIKPLLVPVGAITGTTLGFINGAVIGGALGATIGLLADREYW